MERPDKLGEKGAALWDRVTEEFEFDAAGYAILEDICRTTDTVWRLQKKLNSPHCEWVRMTEDNGYKGEGVKILVVVDGALAEIRQQRLALRQMWQHLGLGKVIPKNADEGEVDDLWSQLAKVEGLPQNK
ncbi:hypothetical protein Wildcat_25 [Mycobacterium phage Wildcat]|uniref:Terminase small subunit n=3 Tax=Mycobacterium virus Wildcat TaxID=1993859 RepID=Q19Y35_9CAUD|nr:terminase small subunit [Mycobacterium phage Wildcat]ABE67630.1 hypothetical protein Wildcat_25 [Mycobacterium phage Wildcat]AJD82097.1 hypothetical protein COSMO_25 [Mycobacterium phage Cosmo]QGJ89915.1 terminase small subunit [Mycobacterium phage MaryV]WKR36035.1 terminase [Mycobacterium phage Azrael100]